jgi:hypothetical protein
MSTRADFATIAAAIGHRWRGMCRRRTSRFVPPLLAVLLPLLPFTPAHALAFAAAATPPASAIVPGLAPGGVIPMTLAGGTGPIQVTIDAGASTAMFSLARRPVLTSRLGTKTTILPLGQLSASSDMLGIRFAGVSSLAALPGPISLRVQAKDASGATVNFATVVYAIVPNLTVDTSFTSKIARQAADVSVRVDRLPPGIPVSWKTNQVFSGLTVAETNCFFFTAGPPPAAVNADISGVARLTLAGAFGVRAGTSLTGPCTFAAEFMVGSTTFLLKKVGIALAAPVTYTINETASLTSKFSFAESNLLGIYLGNIYGACSGDSLGVEIVPVGVRSVGSDLALRIRSGPLGTGCEWRSRRAPAATGLQLTEMNWSVAKVGTKCCAGNKTQCDPERSLGYANTAGTPWVDGSGSNLGTFFDGGGGAVAAAMEGATRPASKPSEWGRPAFVPFTVRLRCDATIVNDHGVTLRLDSVKFLGPPGLGESLIP